jgi:uncharacterized protein YfiM (DUF2279 family)
VTNRLVGAAVLFLLLSFPLTAACSDKPEKDEWISQDKLLHLLTSSYMVGFSYRAYHDGFDNPPGNSRVFAVSVTALSGIGKEIYDLKRPERTASWKDIAADAAGIVLGVLVFTYAGS